jgi:protoheme IX farnesyltransferase
LDIIHRARAYLQLTKPTIQLLVVLTGAAALVYEGSLLSQPGRFALVLIGLALSAGSAKALNQYLERRLDALMARTKDSRPLPRGQMSPMEALIFALALGLGSVALFACFFNLSSALITAATILFYSLFYTLYLKPRSPYSIVIGGIAGGMGPVIAWAATGTSISAAPLLMLLVIFFWTPPHFWALAYGYREDFVRAGYPTLLESVSAERFWRIVFWGAAAALAASLTLLWVGAGAIYLSLALLTGLGFLWQIQKAAKQKSLPAARRVFHYSMFYLVVLFAALIADRVL